MTSKAHRSSVSATKGAASAKGPVPLAIDIGGSDIKAMLIVIPMNNLSSQT